MKKQQVTELKHHFERVALQVLKSEEPGIRYCEGIIQHPGETESVYAWIETKLHTILDIKEDGVVFVIHKELFYKHNKVRSVYKFAPKKLEAMLIAGGKFGNFFNIHIQV